MLLTQTILLSLALGISAHRVRDGHYARGGGRFGSGGGGQGSSGKGSTTTTSAVVAAASSSTTAAAAAASSVASSSGSSVAAGVGNSSTVAASSGSNNGGGGSSSGAALLAANVQPASDSTGSANAEAGQSNSATDPENFINFCTGKNTTDGFQVVTGSCNGIVMGDIPSSNNMISSLITNPGPGDTIASNTPFNITVQVTNLAAGTFTNPLLTYYAAPQALKNGIIIGHTHVTVQSLGSSIVTSTPPDPQTFAFFKGINDAGNGEGLLSATVAAGLPAGAYRVCTLTAAANHQPVLMPVAQRGAQDDCNKFTVSDSGAASAVVASSAGSSAAAASSVAAAGAASSSVAAGSNSTVAVGSSNGGSSSSGSSGKGGNKGKNGRRFATREFIA